MGGLSTVVEKIEKTIVEIILNNRNGIYGVISSFIAKIFFTLLLPAILLIASQIVLGLSIQFAKNTFEK